MNQLLQDGDIEVEKFSESPIKEFAYDTSDDECLNKQITLK